MREYIINNTVCRINGKLLVKSLKEVSYAAAPKDEPKQILTGVNISLDDQNITFCAIDGFRLAVISTDKVEILTREYLNFTVHLTDVKRVMKTMNKNMPCVIRIKDSQTVEFILDGGNSIQVNTINGTFPNYKSFLEVEGAYVYFNRDKLLKFLIPYVKNPDKKSFYIVNIISSENVVSIHQSNDTITPTSFETPYNVIAVKSLRIDGFLERSFQVKYLIDILKRMGEIVEVKTPKDNKLGPFLFETIHGKHLLMPVYTQRDAMKGST